MKELPEIFLKRMDENKKPFKYAEGLNIGFRNKIGGKPDFISESEYPLCQECNKMMSFYGQLDSVDDENIIADCGLISVFVCFDCYRTQSVIVSS